MLTYTRNTDTYITYYFVWLCNAIRLFIIFHYYLWPCHYHNVKNSNQYNLISITETYSNSKLLVSIGLILHRFGHFINCLANCQNKTFPKHEKIKFWNIEIPIWITSFTPLLNQSCSLPNTLACPQFRMWLDWEAWSVIADLLN